MNTYDNIYEELQDRVNNGEITLEFAESVNDLAYDKYYFTEMKKKADYRREKFLKQHNYDPKTKTIDMDGQKVRFKFIGGSNKRHVGTKSAAWRHGYHCRDKNGDEYVLTDTIDEVQMDNAAFNMKHPKSHEWTGGHEIAGHVENQFKKERKTAGFSGKFDDSFSGLPDEAKRIYLEIRRLNKKAENRTLTAEEYKKAKQLKHKLSEIESKRLKDHNDKAKFKALVSDVDDMIDELYWNDVPLTNHGKSPYEYIADYAGAARMKDGIKIAKKTLKEDEKRRKHPERQKKIKNKMMNDGIGRMYSDLSDNDRQKLADDRLKHSNEEFRNEMALRRKSLDMMDKNPNASYIRDKNKGNKNK